MVKLLSSRMFNPMLRGANHLKGLKEFYVPGRYNYAYQLFVCFDGQIQARVGEWQGVLERGEGWIYAPGHWNAFEALGDPVDFGTLCFSLQLENEERMFMLNKSAQVKDDHYWMLADPVYRLEGWPAFPCRFQLSEEQCKIGETLMRAIAEMYRYGKNEASLELRAKLMSLLARIQESLSEISIDMVEGDDSWGGHSTEHSAEVIDRMANLCSVGQEKERHAHSSVWHDRLNQFLSEHHHLDIGRDDLARYMKVSPSHLTNRLRLEGLNFTEVLTLERLDRAKELLSHSRLSCKDIARRVGFKDASYFTKVFRERMETSPARWRKAMKGMN